MSEKIISRKLCFLLVDEEVIFPCTMKNSITKQQTFRVSRFGGNELNHADPKKREEEATEDEMVKFVMEMGYSTRFLRANRQSNLYSLTSPTLKHAFVVHKKQCCSMSLKNVF